jgi:hypothetical protein
VEEAWALGQRAIEILQEELGGKAEILLAVEGGGVQLHSIYIIIYDVIHSVLM